MKVKTFWLVSLLLFASCSSLKIARQDNNNSIVAISATTTGALQKGYGITIILENIDTQERFESKSLTRASPHSIIQNIPQGRYFVYQVSVPLGNMIYHNRSNNVREFFGQINIEPNSKYYLGNFSGRMEGVGRNVSLILRINDPSIPDKLRERIENENTGWKKGEFIKLFPYKNDELIIRHRVR